MSELPIFIQALLDSKAYPSRQSGIELQQTQMSFIFLTDNYVYKVKKPVNLGYLDYTTLEKRHLYCQREVELNRRLCPDAYLGVVSITQNNGNFFIEGSGEVIEYAVKIRRLPRNAMMDILLANNRLSLEMVGRLAQRLISFHREAATDADISTFGHPVSIAVNVEENFNQTEKYIGDTISSTGYQHIKDYTNRFLEQNNAIFLKRIEQGKIRDCHGDLHAAHICFTNGICIYDCIEFNDRFRYCDVASEIAFLAMDLDHHGRADLSQRFINFYITGSQDKELFPLLDFYKCYRAYVRGKVESFKLDDPHISIGAKSNILTIAREYFILAESYI